MSDLQTLQKARERYEMADAELVWATRQLSACASGSSEARIFFLRVDLAATRREEKLAALWRAMDERRVAP